MTSVVVIVPVPVPADEHGRSVDPKQSVWGELADSILDTSQRWQDLCDRDTARAEEAKAEAAEPSSKLSSAEVHADRLAGAREVLGAEHDKVFAERDEQLRLLRRRAEHQA
jgi:hypothetical protein